MSTHASSVRCTTGSVIEDTVKHVIFAWDLSCEFHDSLKIAKFNTSELKKKIYYL